MTDVLATRGRLRQLLGGASKGPWVWDDARRDREDGTLYVPQGSHLGETLIALDDTYENSRVDCELVDAALNALPRLLDALDTAQEALSCLAETADHESAQYAGHMLSKFRKAAP